jgi:hypothetical protein
MKTLPELNSRLEQATLAVEQLEVVMEVNTDEEVKDIIMKTVLELQIAMNEIEKEIYMVQSCDFAKQIN